MCRVNKVTSEETIFVLQIRDKTQLQMKAWEEGGREGKRDEGVED